MSGYGKQFRNEGRVNYDLNDTEDGWHYFGMNWQPEGYTFYYNGKEVSRADKNVSHVPQFILLTTEIKGYRSVKAKANDDENAKPMPFEIQDDFVDDAFIVDFVRVFDKVR